MRMTLSHLDIDGIMKKAHAFHDDMAGFPYRHGKELAALHDNKDWQPTPINFTIGDLIALIEMTELLASRPPGLTETGMLAIPGEEVGDGLDGLSRADLINAGRQMLRTIADQALVIKLQTPIQVEVPDAGSAG